MNINYVAPVKPGKKLIAIGREEKVTRKIGFIGLLWKQKKESLLL
ncbi:MAG: hotdog domain-containing protein [Bacillota bacterium]